MPSIASVLSRARSRHPSWNAIIEWESRRRISYAQLDDYCTALAVYLLKEAGLQPGNRVGICLPNIIEFIIAQFGILRAGLVATYVNYRLSINEAARQLMLADAKILITTRDRAEAFHSLQEIHKLDLILADTEEPCRLGLLLSSILTSKRSGSIEIEPSPTSDALLRFTSGTTGDPKGVFVTHRAWVTRAVHILAEGVRIEEGAIVLLPGPLTHASGLLVLPSFLKSATLLLMRKFESTQLVNIMDTFPVRYTTMVPTMIKMIIDDNQTVQKLQTSGLKQITYGGAPISQAVLDKALKKMDSIAFVQSYGSHEAGQISYLDEFDHRSTKLRTSAGRPLLTVEARIEPIEGEEYGELLVSTPWKAHSLLKQSGRIDVTNEWVHTGDLGEIRDGYIFLIDRLNDLIISGGFNIYPGEVERRISTYPGIEACGVVGVPDEKWGEKVVAYIVNKPGAVIKEDELRNYCKRALAGYKVPKEFIWVEDIPLNAAGKPDRRQLAAPRWHGYNKHIH